MPNADAAQDLKELQPSPYEPASLPINGHTVLTRGHQRKGGLHRTRTIRRLICKLDDLYLPRHLSTEQRPTHRKILARQPAYFSSLGMPLDSVLRTRADSALHDAALNLNLAFSANYSHRPLPSRSTARNPAILRNILDPLKNGSRSDATEGIVLAHWLMENVQLPKGYLQRSRSCGAVSLVSPMPVYHASGSTCSSGHELNKGEY